jgi:hypothetical protein
MAGLDRLEGRDAVTSVSGRSDVMSSWMRITFVGLLVVAPMAGLGEVRDSRGVAPDRDEYQRERGPIDRSAVQDVARRLDDRARRVLNMVRRHRDSGRDVRSLFDALTEFTSGTNTLARGADDARRGDVREAVRHLLRMGEGISRAMDGAESTVRVAWRDVDDELARLGDQTGEQYESARGDSRREYRRDGGERRSGGGYLRWRGRVDGSDCIVLRGDRVTIRHLEARPVTQDSHDLSSALPRRPLNVRLQRIQGRGRITLSREPTAANGYTAEVCIEDDKGGDDLYEFELTW